MKVDPLVVSLYGVFVGALTVQMTVVAGLDTKLQERVHDLLTYDVAVYRRVMQKDDRALSGRERGGVGCFEPADLAVDDLDIMLALFVIVPSAGPADGKVADLVGVIEQDFDGVKSVCGKIIVDLLFGLPPIVVVAL